MNPSPDDKDFLVFQHYPQVKRLVEAGEPISLQVMPSIGASRVRRKLMYDLDCASNTLNIDLSVFSELPSKNNTLQELSLELKNTKDDVKLICVSQIDFDRDEISELLRIVTNFRKSKIKTPSLLFFLTSNPYEYASKLNTVPGLFVNSFYLSPLQPKFIDIVIGQNENRFGIKLNKEQKEMASEMSGGVSILIKNIVRQLSQYGSIDKDQLIFLARGILEELSEKELQSYYKAVKGGLSLMQKNHLKQLGLVDEELKVKSSLLKDAILSYKRDLRLEFAKDHLFIGGNNRTAEFTEEEAKFLKVLWDKGFLAREKTAALFSGKVGYLEFSEEALDQRVSRLRTKMKRLGLSPDRLITRKGKGYEYDRYSEF